MRDWESRMPKLSLAARVDVVERKVENLADLPPRMSAVEGRLSNVEGRLTNVEVRLTNVEVRLTNVEVRLTSVESQIVQLRREMQDGFSAIREEIRAGDEETRQFMRVLHEDVISRIAALQEGMRPPAQGR